MKPVIFSSLLIIALTFFACGKKKEKSELDEIVSEITETETEGQKKSHDNAGMTLKKKIKRGKTLYLTYCIACHNMNPKLIGALGPEVYGASEELLRLRILEKKYPEGYKPKRKTKLMEPIPELKDDIVFLHAYLNN